MPVDLSRLAHPGHSALVLQECQRGVIGDRAKLSELAEAAAPIVPRLARLVAAARRSGVQVVHCTAAQRPDFKGSNRNARLFEGARRRGVCMPPGSEAVEVIPEVGLDPEDLLLTRLHGLGPMGGTDLDAILRNLGVRTIVAVGVSVNVAITNLVMDGVNAGYDLVLPTDAVAGVPETFAQDVVRHTLSLLAFCTTVDELVGSWEAPAPNG